MRYFGSTGFSPFQFKVLDGFFLWKAGGIRFKALYLMVITPFKNSLQNYDVYAKFMPNKTQTVQKEITDPFPEWPLTQTEGNEWSYKKTIQRKRTGNDTFGTSQEKRKVMQFSENLDRNPNGSCLTCFDNEGSVSCWFISVWYRQRLRISTEIMYITKKLKKKNKSKKLPMQWQRFMESNWRNNGEANK